MEYETTTLLDSLNISTSTETDEDDDDTEEIYDWQFYFKVYAYCNLCVIVLTMVTVIYGVASWMLIKKWQTFKNYVFLNISAAAFFKHLTEQLANEFTYAYDRFGFVYDIYIVVVFAYNLWLLVLCMIFYSSIVNIFKPPVNGRFWKSALLAWGVPTILGIMKISNLNIKFEYFDVLDLLLSTFLPGLVSFVIFVMYMVVLCKLLKSAGIRSSSQNIRGKFQVATLLLLMSGVSSLACLIVDVMSRSQGLFALMVDNADLLPSIIVAIWVFGAKSNRELWRDYYQSRIRTRLVAGLMMNMV